MKGFFGIAKTRTTLLIVSAFAPLCFGVLVGHPGSSSRQTGNDIRIVNKTTTIEVALETTADNLPALRLKNISSRDLNGYVVAIKNQVTITTDLSSGNRVILPGQSDEMRIPLRASPMEVTLLAAMFADGTVEGEPVFVAELKQWRLGLKEELTRNLAVLDALLRSPDIPKALESLEPRLSLSNDSEVIHGGKPSGIRTAKNSLKTEIELLKKRLQRGDTLKHKDAVLELKRRLERRIASI